MQCFSCRKNIIPEGIGTGYGTRHIDGRPYCYACCGELDKAAMRRGEKITLYLTVKTDRGANHCGNTPGRYDYELTNWPGTLRLPCHVKPRKHNMAAKAFSVWAWFEGRQWFGVQADSCGQIVTMRPLKINPARVAEYQAAKAQGIR